MRPSARGSRPPSLLLPALLALMALCLAPPGARAQAGADLEVATWRGHAVVRDRLLVQFEVGLGAEQRRQHHDALGARRLGSPRADLELVALPAGSDLDRAAAAYAALPGVLRATPDTLHTRGGPTAPATLAAPPPAPDVWSPGDPAQGNPGWSLQWHLPKLRADVAWPGLVSSPDALVAVIDSGIDSDHEDLADALVFGLDTYAGDADPEDLDGHGTHCAGLAAAVAGNGIGVDGAARGGRLLAYRCGNSSYPTSALVPAIDDAVARGALVISMSWGSYWNDPNIAAALADAADAGVLLVAAAGNDALNKPFHPAALPGVIGVGSSRQNDGKSSFSNFGAWVDLAAPGQGLYSTWKNGAYLFSSGTSMACPLVAGMAAQLYANLGVPRSPTAAAAVRAALADGAADVGGWVANGWALHGRVDFEASAALLFDAPAAATGVTPAEVEALAGGLHVVSGSGLLGLDAVALGGQPAGHQVIDDGTLHVWPGDQPLLGATTLQIHKDGAEVVLPVTVTATDPPRLELPATVADGGELRWAAGGGAGHQGWLLAALDPATFSLQGHPILTHLIVLTVLPLDGAGLADLEATLPAGFGGLTFHCQLADVDGGALQGSSAVTTTVILD